MGRALKVICNQNTAAKITTPTAPLITLVFIIFAPLLLFHLAEAAVALGKIIYCSV